MFSVFLKRSHSDEALQMDSLDGMRGLAALLVVVSHTSMVGWHFFPGLDMYGSGKSGVYLFFVLSSFLLTYQMISKGRNAFSSDALINFGLRRVLRVYPLYTAYLLSAIISTILINQFLPERAPEGLPFPLEPNEFGSLFFLQHAKGVEWSVVVEFKFYFLLPFVSILYAVVLKNNVIGCFLVTLLLVAGSQAIWPPSTYLTNDYRLGVYLPIFFIGSFLAVLHKAIGSIQRIGPREGLAIEALGVIAGLVLLCFTPPVYAILSGSDVKSDEINRQFILFAVLWSVVLLSSLHGLGMVGKAFSLKMLRYFGFISFSVYLSHVSIIKIVSSLNLSETVSAWLVFGVVMVFSTISYRVIELPASRIKWKN